MKTKNADGRLQESDLDIAEKKIEKKDDEPITACVKGELTGYVLFQSETGRKSNENDN